MYMQSSLVFIVFVG